jgi:hypothetical protein
MGGAEAIKVQDEMKRLEDGYFLILAPERLIPTISSITIDNAGVS